MKILFLTSRLPFPPIGGDRLRTFNFVKYLGARHAVTVVSFVENEREVENAAEHRDLYEKLITVPLPRAKSYLNCVAGVFSSRPLQVHYYRSSRMKAIVDAELASNHYDIVVSHLIRMVQYLPFGGPPRTWIDFTDAISLYHARRSQLPGASSRWSAINWVEARRVGPYERAAMQKADHSIFISSVDAEWFSRSGDGRIAVVPNGVDLDRFAFEAADYDPDRIVFLGNMRTFPNTDAALFFARDVLPLVRRERPGATFAIVGNQPPPAIRELHNGRDVIVTGAVDSVIPYLREAAVLVAPMRACSGVQNKMLEALAVGTPVVTTSMGAEGLETGTMVIGNTPEEIARATVEVMNDRGRRQALSEAGRRYVETHCTWEQALSGLDTLMDDAGAGRSRPASPSAAGSDFA